MSLRSILILSSHLILGLRNGLFPSSFLIEILYEFLIPYGATCPAHLFEYCFYNKMIKKYFHIAPIKILNEIDGDKNKEASEISHFRSLK
jgi:hypothetical protein